MDIGQLMRLTALHVDEVEIGIIILPVRKAVTVRVTVADERHTLTVG